MNPTDALPPGIVFAQPLTPVAHSLLLSFLVAVIPIAVALIALGVLRRPRGRRRSPETSRASRSRSAHGACRRETAFNAVGAGMALAVVPVMWIVFNALLLYNIAVKSGRFDQFRQWMLDNLPDDRRLVLLVVAFSFGCLLEGISGFGTPVAITSALLIALGFPRSKRSPIRCCSTRRRSRSARSACRSPCSARSRRCRPRPSRRWSAASCRSSRCCCRSTWSARTAGCARSRSCGPRCSCRAAASRSRSSSRRTSSATSSPTCCRRSRR